MLKKCTLSLVGLLLCGPAIAGSAVAGSSTLPTTATTQAAPERSPLTEPWSVNRGAELQSLLYDWAARAGWTLVWESEYAYRLQADAHFGGDFATAVKQLFAALGAVTPSLHVNLYEGNRVLLVRNQPGQ